MRACEKIRYGSKRAAKRARRRISDLGLRPYRCLSCDGAPWHLGHLPARILQGEVSRAEVYGE